VNSSACTFGGPACQRVFSSSTVPATTVNTCNYPSGNCSQQYTVHIWAHNNSGVDSSNASGFFTPGTGYGTRSAISQHPLVSYAGDNIPGIFSCGACHASTTHYPNVESAQGVRAFCEAAYGTCTGTNCSGCSGAGASALGTRQRIFLCPSNSG